MRDSIADIEHMVRDIPYPGGLPKELEQYHVYLTNSGHSILCVPSVHRDAALKSGAPFIYEVPAPVKFVLSHNYEMEDGYIFLDVMHCNCMGIAVDMKYYEF